MIAYVIKNKDGKYSQITFNGWINFVSELCCAYIYHSKQGAEKIIKCHELEDCEVVEITIAEGDLEQENKTLRRALELACDDLGLYEDVTSMQLKMRCYKDQAKKEMGNDKE